MRRGIEKMGEYIRGNALFLVLVALLAAGLASLFVFDAKRDSQSLAQREKTNKKLISEDKELQEISADTCEVIQKAVDQALPGIVCWGDSLTAGAGGDSVTYPAVLQRLIRQNLTDTLGAESIVRPDYDTPLDMAGFRLDTIPVANMGGGDEDTKTILGRNGAVPFTVGKDFTVPESLEPVEIKIKGGAPLGQGTAGMEWVRISGILGTVSRKQDSSASSKYTYFFTRSEKGKKTKIQSGTKIITSGSTQYLDYLPVIFMGQNGGYSDEEELIEQQRLIISHQTANQKRFIILGLHTGTAKERKSLEASMKKEYGDKYINLREYMCTRGIKDANKLLDAAIEETKEDRKRMEKGMTPASLMLEDQVHFNHYGYELIGRLIYERMDENGYFDGVKSAIRGEGLF